MRLEVFIKKWSKKVRDVRERILVYCSPAGTVHMGGLYVVAQEHRVKKPLHPGSD